MDNYEKYAGKYNISNEEITKAIEAAGYENINAGTYLLKMESGGFHEYTNKKTGEPELAIKANFRVEGALEDENQDEIGKTVGYYQGLQNDPKYTTVQKIGNFFKFMQGIDYNLSEQYHEEIKVAENDAKILEIIETCLIAFTDSGKSFKCEVSYGKGDETEKKYPKLKPIVEDVE